MCSEPDQTPKPSTKREAGTAQRGRRDTERKNGANRGTAATQRSRCCDVSREDEEEGDFEPEEHLRVVARSGVVRDAHNQVANIVEVRQNKPEGDVDQEAEAAHLHIGRTILPSATSRRETPLMSAFLSAISRCACAASPSSPPLNDGDKSSSASGNSGWNHWSTAWRRGTSTRARTAAR